MEAAAARAMPRLLRIYSNDEGVYVAAKLAVNNLARLNDELHAFAAAHPVDKLLDQVSLAQKRSHNRLLSSPSATPPLPPTLVCACPRLLTGWPGNLKSSLDGRLVALKDNICTTELPTACASAMLRGSPPISPFSSFQTRCLSRGGRGARRGPGWQTTSRRSMPQS